MLGKEDALANYTFHIEVDGRTIAQFTEVSGLSSEIQVIEHQEGGKGGTRVYKKLPGSKKSGDITLKRGKTDNKELWQWHKKAYDGKIDEARSNFSVVLFDYARGEIDRYDFMNGWPSKISIGALQAKGNDILVEETTITHEGMIL